MKYNLQLFDKLIENLSEDEGDEVKSIIEEIKQTACSLRTEEEIRLYIQNLQSILIEQKNFYPVYQKCDKILHFLETNFHKFVNEMLPISDVGRNKISNQYNDLIDKIGTEIKSSVIEKLQVYIQPLTDIGNHKQCTIYYIRYVSLFWENWVSDFTLSSNTLKEEAIVSFLISQNFNPPLFFKYITSEIIGELHQEDDPYIQEQVLLSYSQRFNKIPAKIGNPFRPDYPHIKPLLIEWLKIEIKQCRKKIRAFNSKQQTILPGNKEYKIETSLSVAQTAYLLKILSKTGIITNKVQMDILHVVSEKFRSRKTETISFDSLHNKYYNVEDRTRESVKEILKDILKQIDGI